MLSAKVRAVTQAMAFGGEMWAGKSNHLEAKWQSGALRHRFPAGHRKYEVFLQDAVRIGWMRSIRGPNGGYYLSEKGKRVSVYDILEKFGVEEDQPLLSLFQSTLERMKPGELIKRMEDHKAANRAKAA